MRGLIVIILLVAGIYLVLHYAHTRKVVEDAQGGIKGLRQTRIATVRADLRSLAQDIESKYLTEGEYPDSLQEVKGRVPEDPWGHPIIYRKLDGGFELISAGPDGIEGTEDDIVVRR